MQLKQAIGWLCEKPSKFHGLEFEVGKSKKMNVL
jgi:hypothetical protein